MLSMPHLEYGHFFKTLFSCSLRWISWYSIILGYSMQMKGRCKSFFMKRINGYQRSLFQY